MKQHDMSEHTVKEEASGNKRQDNNVIKEQPVKKDAHLSPQEKHKRKQRVLTQGTPSITSSIADALVLKNGNIFFLSQPDGDVPLSENHGYGLYYHDCRYLNGYQLKIAHASPTLLVSNASTGFSSTIEMTNPEIQKEQGVHIKRDSVGIKWERVLDGDKNVLFDTLTFHNYGLEDVTFPVSLAFQAHFEDVFTIRGLLKMEPGKIQPPRWHEDAGRKAALVFEYAGADGLFRTLAIHFSPSPVKADRISAEKTSANFSIHLQPGEDKQIVISLQVVESKKKPGDSEIFNQTVDTKLVSQEFQRISHEWLQDQMKMECKELLTKDILNRSLIDLRTLVSSLDHSRYIAAGVPWFATLFGRDSLISSLQMLAFNNQIAAETLRLLAKYQAQETSSWQDSQPGKILHEIRVGELAHLHEIPHTPYYGTVDATPLFLVLVSRAFAWSGNLDLFNELKPHIEAALQWIDQYGDSDGDGYVDYHGGTDHGLVNQGWKDSGDAIVNADGTLAKPPIALPEVQGYVYRAKLGLADLYEKAGVSSRADQLRKQAKDLKTRFNQDFWSDTLGTYVLALQAGGKPAEVVASNAGQVLWTGIADPDKAKQTAKRLMEPDMFNGWGIRTLSTQAKRYNPIGYHLGTVWPFDNSLIAAGFRRYGQDEQAVQVFLSMMEAALSFQEYRLPELFAGFDREEYHVPVHFPVACHPQAWSAGSTPYLLTTLLGLIPDGYAHRLSIVRPRLPGMAGPIALHKLQVGDARVDLSFKPCDDGQAEVHVIKVEGKLDVHVVDDEGEYDF